VSNPEPGRPSFTILEAFSESEVVQIKPFKAGRIRIRPRRNIYFGAGGNCVPAARRDDVVGVTKLSKSCRRNYQYSPSGRTAALNDKISASSVLLHRQFPMICGHARRTSCAKKAGGKQSQANGFAVDAISK
jgi:hypothetical protein